jgi:hypothetical protein
VACTGNTACIINTSNISNHNNLRNMNYRQSMNLVSPSGYAMPFELPESSPLEITLGYGKQTHPHTGKEFFHHGIDFKVHPHTWLKALATGVVSGIASDLQKGFNITVNYRNYAANDNTSFDVTYSHIKESVCNFGKSVNAGDNIAVCDGLLHIEVRFNGTEVNPLEFLTMIRDNLIIDNQKQMEGSNPEIATLGFDVHTPYDSQQQEIDQMYQHFFGNYMTDLLTCRYKVPTSTEATLRDVLTEGVNSGAYYEHAPSMLNPLGLGTRSLGIIGRIQTLLTFDFLNYLALMHGVFLSTMSENDKKKLLTGL